MGLEKEFAVFSISSEGAGLSLISISDVEGATKRAGKGFPGLSDGVEIVSLPLFKPKTEMREKII